MKLKITILLVSFFAVGSLYAQVDRTPQLFGVLKTKYEVSTDDGFNNFSVRNSRMGIRGYAAEGVQYSILAEISSQGSLGLMDSYLSYKTGSFEFVAGQQAFSFNTEVTRGAGRNYFANRSFVAKFLTRYYGFDSKEEEYFVREVGSRDLGAQVKYTYGKNYPVSLTLGVFNGTGMSNPAWRTGMNLSSSIMFGRNDGFGGGVGYYGGKTTVGDRMDMWAVETRYAGERFHIAAEGGQRYLNEGGDKNVSTVGVIYGLYRFPINGCAMFKSIAPIARYDIGENLPFIASSGALESANAQRITAGLTFGLSEKELKTEIRLNYEHYLLKDTPSDHATNRLFHNKLVVEFFASF